MKILADILAEVHACFFALLQKMRLPKPSWGPKACIKDPKRNIEMMKLITTVLVMRMANFLNVIISPPKRKAPEPKVVMQPLRMLIPISS